MIRKALKKDIPSICKLLSQVNLIHHLARPDVFKKGLKYSKSDVEEILKDTSKPILVHENQSGEVDGYCFCVIKTQSGNNLLQEFKTLYVDDLCVDENVRGKGIGTKLFAEAKNLAKQNGCYNVTLNVWSCNPSALKFYKKLGLLPQKLTMEEIL